MVRRSSFILCLVLLALLGCSTSVKVVSEPSGARVEITEIRTLGGWTEWQDHGPTPCDFKTPDRFQLRVRWPDGTRSEIRQVPIRGSGGELRLKFSQKAALPVVPVPPIPVIPDLPGTRFGGLGENIHVAMLIMKKKHHELIRYLDAKAARGEELHVYQQAMQATAYVEIRDYQKALPTLDLLEARVLRGDCVYDHADLGPYVGILRGMVALDMGDPARAVEAASWANAFLNRERPTPNKLHSSELVEIAGVLGVAHAQLGHRAEALLCVKALEDIGATGSVYGPDKFAAIARIHMALHQWDKALAAVLDPRAEVPGLLKLFYNQTFQELPKLFILTKCWYEVGRTQEAKEGCDQLLKHPQIQEIGGLYWLILLDRARIARAEGQPAQAEELLRRAVDVVERQRASIHTEAGRIGYVGDKQEVYQELVSLLVAADRPADAFAFAERAKGRALVDLLASEKRIRPASPQDGALLDRVARDEAGLGVVSEPGLPARGIAIAARSELARQAPALASLVMVPEVSVPEIQRGLAPDESVLEYFSSGMTWYAFVVTRDSVRARNLGTPDLAGLVAEARRAMADPGTDPRPAVDALSAQVLDPLRDLLATPRLTIVPHGVLHYMPFCALSCQGAPILDRFSLRTLPSVSVLRHLKPNKAVPGALVLGNPDLGDPALDLKGAQEEAEAVAGILPHSTLLLRRLATAAAVRDQGPKAGMLHFAVHGVFDVDHPLESALLLSDGALRAGDLYGLSLDAGLVTLSACETALSRVSRGDDVVGFTRGLFYAGAGSVLATLWKVDDAATSLLVQDFYRSLAEHPKDEALRQAQLEIRKTHPHPFYWAAFVLAGNV